MAVLQASSMTPPTRVSPGEALRALHQLHLTPAVAGAGQRGQHAVVAEVPHQLIHAELAGALHQACARTGGRAEQGKDSEGLAASSAGSRRRAGGSPGLPSTKAHPSPPGDGRPSAGAARRHGSCQGWGVGTCGRGSAWFSRRGVQSGPLPALHLQPCPRAALSPDVVQGDWRVEPSLEQSLGRRLTVQGVPAWASTACGAAEGQAEPPGRHGTAQRSAAQHGAARTWR